jgi:hypothetical protein
VSDADHDSEPVPAEPARPAKPEYTAPAILWEQEFVALAMVSQGPCEPYSDPSCT